MSRFGLVIVAAAALVAACAGPTGAATTSARATQAGSPTAMVLQSGMYVNGPPATPRYFATVTTKPDGTFAGTVSYQHQDGQTEAAFTFTATTQSGIATLTTSTGRIITAPFGAQGFTLGECTDYLVYAESLTECTFTFASSG